MFLKNDFTKRVFINVQPPGTVPLRHKMTKKQDFKKPILILLVIYEKKPNSYLPASDPMIVYSVFSINLR